MAETTGISWTDATWNPWIGCTKVSPGCTHCYPETEDKRRGWTHGGWGPGKPRRRTSPHYWRQLQKWNQQASQAGIKKKVFVASLADALDPEVPAEWRRDMWNAIRPHGALIFQVLTKRPELAAEMLPPDWGNGWENIWFGVSVENQDYAWRIGELLKIPAAVRFLSIEPMLGPVDLAGPLGLNDRCSPFPDSAGNVDMPGGSWIDWVITGCESGPGRRPWSLEWDLDVEQQCHTAGVAFFRKQIVLDGRVSKDAAEWPEYLRTQEFPR